MSRLAQCFNMLWHWMWYKFLMVSSTIFNLGKVNTVPCMFAATLSLGQ